MSDHVLMELLSREYGWTPEQIRQQRLYDILVYVEIINTRRHIQKANEMKQRKR